VFDETTTVAAAVAPPQTAPPPSWRSLKSYALAGGLAVVLLAAAAVSSLRARRRAKEMTGVKVLAPVVDAPRLADGDAPMDLKARALERAAQDPATAALVLRFWLGASENQVSA